MTKPKLDQYLQDLGKQGVVDEKLLQVTPNPTLELLCKTFENFLDRRITVSDQETTPAEEFSGPCYQKAKILVKEIEYTAKDVRNFSVELKKYENRDDFRGQEDEEADNVGLFLSALINNCSETDFEIVTQHLSKLYGGLGFENTKNVTVIGNFGTQFAAFMKSGRMIATGNVGAEAAYGLEGGEVIILGNADIGAGTSMNGGVLRIRGSAGSRLGMHSEEGTEIYVDGDIQGRLNKKYCRAKVYHKGELIHKGHKSRRNN